MAGSNIITSQRISPLQQCRPLDMGIAEHAWVWRTPGYIFIYEIIDHMIAEFLPDIQYIMRKTMFHRSLPGIIKRIEITAAGFFFTTFSVAAGGSIVPCLHGHAYYFIPLLVEHQGAYCAVYTATHGYQHFSISTHCSCLYATVQSRAYSEYVLPVHTLRMTDSLQNYNKQSSRMIIICNYAIEGVIL